MHQRQVIRDAIVATLSGRTAAGMRVSSTRTEPWRSHELPAISVYTPSEITEDASKGTSPLEQWRDLDVEIVAWVLHTDAVPAVNALDAIAEQIEAAMNLDPHLGGAAGLAGLELSSSETAVQDGEKRPDPLTGVVRLIYTVPYTHAPVFGTGLDEFLSSGVTTQIEGAGDDNTVSDLIDQRPA